MRSQIGSRADIVACAAMLIPLLGGCRGGGGGGETSPEAGQAGQSSPVSLKNEIPPEVLGDVLRAHQTGLGLMERYEYAQAAAAFREVHDKAPGWIPGSVNLAIALLNQGGEESEESEGGVETVSTSRLDQALDLLAGVLERDPDNIHAHYCRGIILGYVGRTPEANAAFQRVTELAPNDGHAWYQYGSTLPSKSDPDRLAGPDQADELIALYSRALECNPYLVPAMYRLVQSLGWSGDRDTQREMMEVWRKLNPAQNIASFADTDELTYGRMGPYASLIDWSPRPKVATESGKPPRFDVPGRLQVTLPEGTRWARTSDFTGPLAIHGRARARFGAAMAAFDANGDGQLDLYIASAVVGPEGVRDALLLNRGEGRFEEVTGAAGLGETRASLGVAAGDFDADGHIDLFLTGVGDNRLMRNAGEGRFEDVTDTAGIATTDPPAVSLTARFLDLDQDGDLDLYVVNHCPAEHAERAFTDGDDRPEGLPNTAFQNVGVPPAIAGRPPDTLAPAAVAPEGLEVAGGLSIAFRPWPEEGAEALGGGNVLHTGIAQLDLDDDRDLDLVLAADGAPMTAAVNDRLGRFHAVELPDLNPTASAINGLLVSDFDRDGRPDLGVIPQRGKVALWRSRPGKPSDAGEHPIAFEYYPTNAQGWRAASAVDLDLDGAFDLLGLPEPGGGDVAPGWARNAGNGLNVTPLALGPDSTAPLAAVASFNLVGDALPDLLLLRDGEGPFVARNLGNGHRWLALALNGRWKVDPGHMRTNTHGLGAKVHVQGPDLDVSYLHTTTTSGLAQSVAPAVLGLGDSEQAALVRLTWPDGVMQCELNAGVDRLWELAQNNRKTGSCPVLFTWDGTRFVCIGDFLGGGGLGYLIAPGVVSQPDRDEAVFIRPEQMAERGGAYHVSITEPMDEIAYIDHVALDVIDTPPGVNAHPDERFAPGGNRPTGELIAWREEIAPARVTDLKGNDLTEILATRDRRTTQEHIARRLAWIGYAEDHGVVLDFGDRLSRFGPEDRLVLGLDGWVEYPYSQTNYAAATAGFELMPPVLERRRPDGSWAVIEPDPGYPAGLPRMTTLDLTGKLNGPECVLRIRTNMECYYDRAFIAVALSPGEAEVITTTLPVTRATLGYRGYTREVSPDGRLPLIYDYDYVDPAPLVGLRGNLTRYGDVAELLHSDDDRFCVIGPGDEAKIALDSTTVPPLREGWTRSFILRSHGYCKDADPFTVTSDTVGPMPWQGMGDYPFGPDGERPVDEEYQRYLDTFQTRAVGR